MARTRLKAFVRARMTPLPAKMFLNKFYPNINPYPNRLTPSFWKANKLMTGATRIGGVLGIVSIFADIYGIRNYYNNPESSFIVSPEEALLNTMITGSMYYGGPVGFGIGGGAMLARFLNPDGDIQNNFGYCFVAGTKVLLASGEEINIEEVKVGDEILSVNMATMEIETDRVVLLSDSLKYFTRIEMKFENGTITNCSPHHPYYVKGKDWGVYDVELARKDYKMEVGSIEIGDIVYFEDNGMLKETEIREISNTGESVKMHNLKYVKKNNTFFANRILVHNRFNK